MPIVTIPIVLVMSVIDYDVNQNSKSISTWCHLEARGRILLILWKEPRYVPLSGGGWGGPSPFSRTLRANFFLQRSGNRNTEKCDNCSFSRLASAPKREKDLFPPSSRFRVPTKLQPLLDHSAFGGPSILTDMLHHEKLTAF